MRVVHRISSVAALAAVAVGGATALAAPAAAAPARAAAAQAAYNGVCGSGYTVIDSRRIGIVGTLFLTYNSATGRNCAVTIRDQAGAAAPMSVSLSVANSDDPGATDSGNYTSYAGPVYKDARGLCITWSGSIGNEFTANTGHCG